MSCQQASRAQEDPYAFTESAPLQANSHLYANHSSAVSNCSSTSSNTSGSNASATNSTTTTIGSSGASLLLTSSASNSGVTKDSVVVATSSTQPLRVGSSPTLKVRYNGVVTTTTTTTASVMGVQRMTAPGVAATPVFSKPALQIKQLSPGHTTVTQAQLPMVAVGKQIKKVLPQQKSTMMTTVTAGGTKVVSPLQQPQVSPGQQQQQQQQNQQPAVLSTAGGSILKFIKIPPHQLGKGVSTSGGLPQGSFIQVTTSADGGRKLLATSSAGLNPTISVTSTVAATATNTVNRNVSGGTTIVPTISTVSPTKIRLIQPQAQGKIYLQAPNSNSLSATTHISNPISIAALRNSLVKQHQQQQQQQVTPPQQQVVQVPSHPLGQPMKQQHGAQQSPSRNQLQTVQSLQLQQSHQSQMVLQQTKPKQTLNNVSAPQQLLQTKQAPKQGKQLTEVQQQVQKQQQQQQSSLRASPVPVSQQSLQRQEGVGLQTHVINQHTRQVQLQTGVQKSSVQFHQQPQVVQMQQKQSLLLPSPPQPLQLLVQQGQQRKHQQSPQSQARSRQGQASLMKACIISPPVTSSGDQITTKPATNGALLAKASNAATTASTAGVNVLACGKNAESLDNHARRSSGQQSLLIAGTLEHPAKPSPQQQTLVTNNADSGRTMSLGPSGAMKSDARKEIAISSTIANGEITKGGSQQFEGRKSVLAISAKPALTPLNERNGKVKQTPGRKSGSVNKPSAKQLKQGKRSYNHRLLEEQQDPTGSVSPAIHSLSSVPSMSNTVSSSVPSESFQAAFAKMARPAMQEPHSPNIVNKPVTLPTPKSSKVKKERARKLFSDECDQEGATEVKPAKLKFVAPKVPGAIAVPITRPKVKEWHAPGSYMFDLKDPGHESDEDAFEGCPNTLSFWYEESIAVATPDSSTGWGMNLRQARSSYGGMGMRGSRNKHMTSSMHDLKFQIRMLTRDERLELKKAYLQRRTVQCRNGLRMRNISAAKRKLESMATLIKRLEKRRMQALNKESVKPKCVQEGCDQAALVRTSHCYNHITENIDQRLFQRCTAKFADNSQCRLPVFDISHELVLCKEHAWKHDNHDKMSQEVKSQKKPVAAALPFAVTGATSNVTVSASRKKTKSSLSSAAVLRPQKRPKKKKKLSPLQQQLQLHQQQYKQFVALNQQQHAHCVQTNQQNAQSHPVNGTVNTPANIVYQHQQQQHQQQKVLLSTAFSNGMVEPEATLEQQALPYEHDRQFVMNGGMVGSVPVKQQMQLNSPQSNGVVSIGNRNMHIPLMEADNNHTLDMIGSTVYQGQQDDTPMHLVDHQLQQHAHQQDQEQVLQQQLHHQSLPDDQLMLSYMEEQQLHQQQQLQQQQQQQLLHQQQQQLQYVNRRSHSVQPMLNATPTQDLLTICENSSAYASSEDTGVGGLSESELMATQEVIEEIIPFEIGSLLHTNVLSQLAPDALNELLFAGGEQDEHDAGTAFEGTTREVEDDIERALEHVKSLDDMGVESANFLGDFLENVDDEMLDGADICSSDQMLQSPTNANDIRGLVHT